MLDIRVESKKFDCSLRLNERVTIITGDSGRGKTILANALVNDSGAYKVTLSDSGFKPVLVTSSNWRMIFEGIISKSEKALVIVDDDDVVCKAEFAELYSQISNCYFILILRTKKLESVGGIGVSAKEIYDFISDGKDHYAVRRNQIKHVEPKDISPKLIDECITEDSKGAFMLKVYFNRVSFEIDGCISNTSKYFDAEYEPSWFSSEEAKQIIRDIDNSEYISGEYIESPVLGGISPMMLSTGCKTLLLLLNEPELIVSGDRMGDNCFPWLLRIAQERDVTITLSHSVELDEPFEMYSIESNKMVKTNLEILEELYP